MTIRKFIFFITALSLCTKAFAQYPAAQTDAWLESNASEMGGRVVLMIWHDGHIVYSHTVNNMTMRQKFIYRAAANRAGKTADLEDFSPGKRVAIFFGLSCHYKHEFHELDEVWQSRIGVAGNTYAATFDLTL